MRPSLENINDKSNDDNHRAPGTISNASTDSTVVLDNMPETNNDKKMDINRNFSNTLSMSTNGDLNKTNSCTACCCSCEHSKCQQCSANEGFTNIALDMTNDDVLDSLGNNSFSNDAQDDDFDDREISWNDFDISKLKLKR